VAVKYYAHPRRTTLKYVVGVGLYYRTRGKYWANDTHTWGIQITPDYILVPNTLIRLTGMVL
jgi:hypothetical protein